ncbi:hypothetical protein M3P05_09740 [Sansalvadorimonas sp. 2012CJ34-2]|uniref:CCT domain-containing protein n=1 Tax=Parendozoicomonas callyspongiae TaxID=2942213 RepID=A0ABT0PGR6_9GAMM|nr:hypothetical protein [Sansalvadorimonas sp. 2012CJ34-2]MCL6270206.1 hypothetical protein [Sansalvadorimonas sp. 2012CJ34-2]
MSGINIPPAMPPAGFNLNTSMANFEEEKTFFASMWVCKYVVINPNTPRKLKRKKSRKELEREASSLGKVIRRYRIQGANMKKSAGGTTQYDGEQD